MFVKVLPPTQCSNDRFFSLTICKRKELPKETFHRNIYVRVPVGIDYPVGVWKDNKGRYWVNEQHLP